MSSPIGFREFNEHEYRKFIRTLSDDELVRAGKQLRVLCGDVVTTVQCVFDQQLKICRTSLALRFSKNHGCAAYSLLGIDRCERKTDTAAAGLSPIVTTSTRAAYLSPIVTTSTR